MTDKLTVSVSGAADMTSLSKDTILRMINCGQLTRHKVGAKVLIKVSELEKFINDSVVAA